MIVIISLIYMKNINRRCLEVSEYSPEQRNKTLKEINRRTLLWKTKYLRGLRMIVLLLWECVARSIAIIGNRLLSEIKEYITAIVDSL